MPRPTAILETVLYAADLAAMADFYTRVIGLDLISEMDTLSIVLRISEGAVLLIFNPMESGQPGRLVPSHGTSGQGHIAFRIDEGSLDAWRDHLHTNNIPIEQEHDWPASSGRNPGHSIYIRDPAGTSVELITADIWPHHDLTHG